MYLNHARTRVWNGSRVSEIQEGGKMIKLGFLSLKESMGKGSGECERAGIRECSQFPNARTRTAEGMCFV